MMMDGFSPPSESSAPNAIIDRPDIEEIKHLWDVWQYRHTFFWSALIRWGAAIVIVSAIPHLKPQFVLAGDWVIVFPVTGILLVVFSSIHLIGEHQRLVAATRRYLECCGTLAPPKRPEHSHRPHEFTFATGIGVIIIYFVSLTCLSVVNAIYLTSEPARNAAIHLIRQDSKDSACAFPKFCR